MKRATNSGERWGSRRSTLSLSLSLRNLKCLKWRTKYSVIYRVPAEYSVGIFFKNKNFEKILQSTGLIWPAFWRNVHWTSVGISTDHPYFVGISDGLDVHRNIHRPCLLFWSFRQSMRLSLFRLVFSVEIIRIFRGVS